MKQSVVESGATEPSSFWKNTNRQELAQGRRGFRDLVGRCQEDRPPTNGSRDVLLTLLTSSEKNLSMMLSEDL